VGFDGLVDNVTSIFRELANETFTGQLILNGTITSAGLPYSFTQPINLV
jgi:hypothetical protein